MPQALSPGLPQAGATPAHTQFADTTPGHAPNRPEQKKQELAEDTSGRNLGLTSRLLSE